MNFKQDELISSGYIFYTLGITVVLLIAAYFILFFFKKNLISKFSRQLKNVEEYKIIRLSSKVTLYIIDKNDYDLVVVESSQNVSVTHIPKCNGSELSSDRQSCNEP
ncbi:hypothetical protein NDN11_11660 [Acinetobacter sp. C26M]|uniref:hypothetical protein n=1 Tax=unclassified Acinetobacter TaxID=196816 RepID=UPI00203680E7|nr:MULTISPECIES: hypothetical protein [unclassified Acinetobacter]USA45378.1 hypothetical protein NDN11_11660 [Acinetobacter sp. C26M]USA48880.1 hypothetical protein NDN12_11660 [Acinetobacter sp. C26G]